MGDDNTNTNPVSGGINMPSVDVVKEPDTNTQTPSVIAQETKPSESLQTPQAAQPIQSQKLEAEVIPPVIEEKPEQQVENEIPPAIISPDVSSDNKFVAEEKPQEKPAADASVPPPPRKRNIVKPLIILVIIAIIAGISFFAYKFFTGSKEPTQTEITWWGLWEDENIIKSLINEYQTNNPKITIKYVKQSPQDYRERLVNAMAQGQAPDIFRFHNTWVPMLSRELDDVPASVISAADYATTYFPVVNYDMASTTRLTGIPLGYDALTLYINDDIFKTENIDPPTTWIEVREKAKQLTKIENEVITQSGVALGRTENVDHWPEIIGLMMLQNGVNMTNPEGKLAEDALVFFTLFSQVDKVWNETLPSSTEMFAAGNLAMYFAPSWRAFNLKEMNPDLNFRTIPLPQLPKENPNDQDYSYATYWVEGVWARSEKKQQAWDFLKFISSKESLEKFYTAASQARGFGEAYPRVDMANTLLEHPVLGSIIKLAPEAQSWYLASRTFDGPTGINSQINKYFEDAINGINSAKQLDDIMETLTPGIKQVLTQYGLARQ